ncbi:hypothetical protein PT015_16750 [Candidatus Mycobacterium wuenschmannii]|uniref:Transmembrane protein n=1 Tax=Candidatus Mycobacterium wuenschmannii TaxID=3027808 RepID=A0ABY8VV42_9MYCO|nr:hypothetical protein [Candidatus Mycobacterium wuenschmannii]WIM86532.1 hypothetical protein PT015_16750 [Candidatus Mycobacterium wuenschmannii]
MQPQYPYYPPPAPPKRHTVTDITLTVILSVLAGAGALGAVAFSFFFIMATDSCGSRKCDYDALGAAYLTTWGGVGVAVLIGVIGVIVTAIGKWTMWFWPAASLVIIAVSTGVGLHLAYSVIGHV